MTRSIPAIAAALLAGMTVLAPAAEACISCDYVPVVVRGDLTRGVVGHYSYRRYYRPYRYRRPKWHRRYWRRRYR